MFLGMEKAGMIQLVKLFLRNIEKAFLETFLSEGGSALAMRFIVAVIFALAIVKESEQPHNGHIGTRNGREEQAIKFHLPPMSKSMNRRIHDSVIIDKLLSGGKINHFP